MDLENYFIVTKSNTVGDTVTLYWNKEKGWVDSIKDATRFYRDSCWNYCFVEIKQEVLTKPQEELSEEQKAIINQGGIDAKK